MTLSLQRYHRNIDIFASGLTYLAMLQAEVGKKTLIPRNENVLDSLESNSPIGMTLAMRKKNEVSDMSIIKTDSKGATAHIVSLEKLIQEMISPNAVDRPTASVALQNLEKVGRSTINMTISTFVNFKITVCSGYFPQNIWCGCGTSHLGSLIWFHVHHSDVIKIFQMAWFFFSSKLNGRPL